jgi:hypothetical protein
MALNCFNISRIVFKFDFDNQNWGYGIETFKYQIGWFGSLMDASADIPKQSTSAGQGNV